MPEPSVPDPAVERRVDAMMDDTVARPEPFADPVTEGMVDDILIKESDRLLAHDDRQPHGVAVVAQVHRSRLSLRRLAQAWWQSRLARYGTALVLLLGAGLIGGMPTSRYYALNTVGVRSATSLTITDSATLQPLKNVTVEVGSHRAKTNQDGMVSLRGLELGSQSLTISQAGFATISQTITLGWGSNPLGEFSLHPVGKQFRFKIVDYLSGKPVGSAEISRGDANAQANTRGAIVLTIDQNDSTADQASISADGYRTERVSLQEGQKQSRVVTLVPSKKELFVSKQSGSYDFYKMDLDGRNRQVLLAASGFEDSDIAAAQNADGSEAAIVSRRDDTRNQDGYRLQTLTLVDVQHGTTLVLDHSEQIRLIDWIGDKLVYVKIKAGTSAGNPERYQLVAYDFRLVARYQLASANYFNDVISAQGSLYYAASNNYQGGNSLFASVRPDNSAKRTLLDKTDVWNIARTSYDSMTLTTAQGTYGYKLGDGSVTKTSDSTAVPSDERYYLDSSDGTHALWTDSRDGKSVLLSYDSITGKDTVITTQTSLGSPIRWLGARTAVYRVATATETADYAVSLDGGEPRKITDLTNTAGFGAWNRR